VLQNRDVNDTVPILVWRRMAGVCALPSVFFLVLHCSRILNSRVDVSYLHLYICLPANSCLLFALTEQYAEQSLRNGTVSVRLSVPFAGCSSVRRVCCCGPGGKEISIACCTAGAAAARSRSTSCSSKCGQCHVFSARRKLNTDLFRM